MDAAIKSCRIERRDKLSADVGGAYRCMHSNWKDHYLYTHTGMSGATFLSMRIVVRGLPTQMALSQAEFVVAPSGDNKRVLTFQLLLVV